MIPSIFVFIKIRKPFPQIIILRDVEIAFRYGKCLPIDMPIQAEVPRKDKAVPVPFPDCQTA